MEKTKQKGLFGSGVLDSWIHSANTTGSEKALGYFFGPCLVYMAYYAIAGTYLTQFYTDVLGITGIFLTLMPVFSKIFDAFTNIIMGRIIDKTHTKQGKARPWILISGIAMAISGILLYAVPNAGRAVQLLRFDVEDKMPRISADITARHKAEVEARGEVYYTPEEKAAMEQVEQEKLAEEKRIEELKAKCARKGLRFEEEEAKYQAKLAGKKAKEAAKKAKKK